MILFVLICLISTYACPRHRLQPIPLVLQPRDSRTRPSPVSRTRTRISLDTIVCRLMTLDCVLFSGACHIKANLFFTPESRWAIGSYYPCITERSSHYGTSGPNSGGHSTSRRSFGTTRRGNLRPSSGNGGHTFQYAAYSGTTHPADGSSSHPPSFFSRTGFTIQYRTPPSSTGKIRGRSQELQILFVNLFISFRTSTLIVSNRTFQSGLCHNPAVWKSSRVGNSCLGGQHSRMPNLLPVFPSYEGVFDQSVSGPAATGQLFRIRQGQRSISDYAIEFCTLAASAGWGEQELHRAYFNGLSERLLDELSTCELPTSLDALIDLTLWIDTRLADRHASRHRRDPDHSRE